MVTSLRAHRLAIAASFFVQGLLFISLTTRLPRFQERWGLGELAVSGLLLMVVLLAGVGSVVAEALSGRRDSATALRLGLVLIAVGMTVLAIAPALAVFVGGLAVYGVGLGVVDAAGNMQAVALEHRYGRPILPSFYGAWTAGGVLGTLVAIALAHLDLRIGLAPLALLGLVAAAAPLLSGTHDTVASGPKVALPWRRISLLGLAIVLFYMVDTAATTWGPIYLRDAFDASDRLVPVATLPYLVAALVARFVGDTVVARFGPAPVVRACGVLAALGLLAIVAAPSLVEAVVGFTVVGAAAAVIAPLSFSAAAVIGREGDLGAGLDADAARRARTDQVIARFNQFNYVGALLGAVLTGVIGAGSLRIGFAVPMVLILAIVPLARQFPATLRVPAR